MKISCLLLLVVFVLSDNNRSRAISLRKGQFRSRILIPPDCKSLSSRILFSWADEFMLKKRDKPIELVDLWRTNPGSFQGISRQIEQVQQRNQNSTFYGNYGFNMKMLLSLFKSPLISVIFNMYFFKNMVIIS